MQSRSFTENGDRRVNVPQTSSRQHLYNAPRVICVMLKAKVRYTHVIAARYLPTSLIVSCVWPCVLATVHV
jgi:hypothetical protein